MGKHFQRSDGAGWWRISDEGIDYQRRRQMLMHPRNGQSKRLAAFLLDAAAAGFKIDKVISGRDYRDVSDSIRHFMREGVVIKAVTNGMVFDGATKDPIQQAVGRPD